MHGDTEAPKTPVEDPIVTDDEPLLKVPQVAKIMNVSERLVGELIRTKELPSYRIRGTRRVAQRHLDEYLARALADNTPTLGERHREAVSRPRTRDNAHR